MRFLETQSRRAAFVTAHTLVRAPPLVPEIRLHLADEITPLWEAENAEFSALMGEVDVPPPYWAFCWPGGQALARYVLDHGDVVRGMKVLVFGAGGGVEAIAAAMRGASEVEAADTDPFSRAVLIKNAALNGVRVNTLLGDVIGTLDQGWDVVLAGDIFYERDLSSRALPWLRALRKKGVRVLVGDPGRSYLPVGALAPLASWDIAVPADVEGRTSWHTTVYDLTL